MDNATAVEVAHQIQELLKTRKVIGLIDLGVTQVIVPDEVSITVRAADGNLYKLAIPPHVMRRVVEDGSLLKACRVLERSHEQSLNEIAGITVEED